MKNLSKCRKGFTLLELLVAMTVTTFIVTSLVAITSIAIDTWNRSRSELRASRQAKAMVDTMARDFEALVIRRGNDFEWLSAITEVPTNSTNAAKLIFLTAATDRYKGEIGVIGKDLGGDVSCVGYLLDYRDPIDSGGASKYETFVLNRLLVNPDETFKELLGQTDLETKFPTTKLEAPENFVCENVFQFTLTFHVEVNMANLPADPPKYETKAIKIGSSGVSAFKIKGIGMEAVGTLPDGLDTEKLKAGRLKAVGISLTVLSDAGVEQLRRRTFSGNQQAEFLAKNSYQYSKLVQLPGM